MGLSDRSRDGGRPAQGDVRKAGPAVPLRLLYLAPFAPSLDGAHGGSRVIAQLLDHISERHHVALMCLRDPDEPTVDTRLRERLAFVEEIDPFRGERTGWSRALHTARARVLLLAGIPLWATDVNVPAFRNRLAVVLDDWRPDVVQIHYAAMAVHLWQIEAADSPSVLWDPDPGMSAAIDLGRISSRSRVLRRLDARAWRRFERDVLRRVDATVVFTERDARTLANQAATSPVVRIPFATDFATRAFEDRAAGSVVVFVGNFVHAPNTDAAHRLVRDIFPLVRERHPSASLQIVGANPPPGLTSSAADNVTVTGRVADAVPYLERASVVAVPVRFGGGMRVKVVEALAVGKPLVASALAVEGLAVTDGTHYLAAETAEEFAAQIGELLVNEALRTSLGRSARAWAEENLTWDGVIPAYDEFYARLLQGAVAGESCRPAHAEFGTL